MCKIIGINGKTIEWDLRQKGYEGVLTALGSYPVSIETDDIDSVKKVIHASMIMDQQFYTERNMIPEYDSVFGVIKIKEVIA